MAKPADHFSRSSKLMLALLAAICVGLLGAGCGGSDSSGSSAVSAAQGESASDAPGPDIEVPDGEPPNRLVIRDLKTGTGRKAENGDTVKVLYKAVNWRGATYSNAWTYAEPPVFELDSGRLEVGFDRGIHGMREGGRRKVIVPPRLTNRPGLEPFSLDPGETQVFVIALLKVL